jgi:hypothetical protein
MFLPSKYVTPDQALIVLGGQVLASLHEPRTVSGTWDAVKHWRLAHNITAPVPFWWFSLALDSLFAINAIRLDDAVLSRRTIA